MKSTNNTTPTIYPKWIVCVPRAAGKRWHVLPSRKAQRAFAKAHNGVKFELRRSR